MEQVFIRAVMDSDWDRNDEFSDRDIVMLEYRLRSIKGVTVNHSQLATRIKQTDRTIESVLKLLQEIDNEELPPDECIVVLGNMADLRD